MITTNLKNAIAYSGIGDDAKGKVQSEVIQTMLNFNDEGLVTPHSPGPELRKEVAKLFKAAQTEVVTECHDYVGLFPIDVGRNGKVAISSRVEHFFSPKDQKRYGLDEFVSAALEAGVCCSSSTDPDDKQHFMMNGRKYRWAVPFPPKGSGKKAIIDPMFSGDIATAKSRVLKYIERHGFDGLTVNMTAKALALDTSTPVVGEDGEPVTSTKPPAEKMIAALNNALRYAKDVDDKEAIDTAIALMEQIEKALLS